MAETGTDAHARVPRAPKYRHLTNTQRVIVVSALFYSRKDGVVKRGLVPELAETFRTTVATIWTVWKDARSGVAPADLTIEHLAKNAKSKSSLRRARKYLHDRDAIKSRIMEMPILQRRNLRTMAEHLDVPLSTLWSWVGKNSKGGNKGSFLRPHSSCVRPHLSDENEENRMLWCQSFVKDDLFFDPMFDTVHVDEKWFYMTDAKLRCYLVEGEEPPQRSVRHKSHIEKVMCLCATARPQPDHNFDGKIGVWFFAEEKPAQRRSVNRERGTMEWKSVSVTKQTYKEMMLTKVLPAIREKCPRSMRAKTIYIQQDNAPPHRDFSTNHPDVGREIEDVQERLGLDIKIRNQPPNSPDMNILDLGFFAAIQSLQYQKAPKNMKQLMEHIEEAHNNYESKRLNRVWLTLMGCMNEVLRTNGDNSYKIPHMNKKRLEAYGELPLVLEAYVADILEEVVSDSDEEEEENEPEDLLFDDEEDDGNGNDEQSQFLAEVLETEANDASEP